MHRFTFSVVIAALMALSGAAQAVDLCDTLGDYPETGLCQAYCSGMNCGSPDARATEAACRNVATTFASFSLGISRRDVTSGETDDAINLLDNNLCRCPDGTFLPCAD